MSQPAPLVFFAFAYVSRRTDPAQYNQVPWLKVQNGDAQRFALRTGRTIVKVIVEARTNRKAAFWETRKFDEALAYARSAGAELVLGDIGGLLERTAPAQIVSGVRYLAALDVRVWNAICGEDWQRLRESHRNLITLKAQSVAVANRSRRQQPPEKRLQSGNHIKATKAAQDLATLRAAKLTGFVDAFIGKLESGTAPSPSALAAALNEQGIRSAQGRPWSHNSAKNLLARLGRQ